MLLLFSGSMHGSRLCYVPPAMHRACLTPLFHTSGDSQGNGPLLADLRDVQRREEEEKRQRAESAGASGPAADGASSPPPTQEGPSAASTLGDVTASVEGAIRNLLTCLGVPMLCKDPGQQGEVTHLTTFALK